MHKKNAPPKSPKARRERTLPAVSVEQRDLPKFSKAGLTHTVGNKIYVLPYVLFILLKKIIINKSYRYDLFLIPSSLPDTKDTN